jgi:cytochrome P450
VLAHPGGRAGLDDQVISAVEELLRYEPPVQFRERTTLTDLEVAGVPIPKGPPGHAVGRRQPRRSALRQCG